MENTLRYKKRDKYLEFIDNLNQIRMNKNLTLDEQQQKENQKDPVTKIFLIIIGVLTTILIIKNLFFNS